MARAQTIQIFLPGGDPSGIRVAGITTRTVRMFEVPRPLLTEFLAMPESKQVGVYYLFGTDDNDLAQCYIGQSGNIGDRLRQHASDRGKDFWTSAMVAVSLTNEWTSTHALFLEWRSIETAMRADRYRLLNGNAGAQPFTPAPLEADCAEFFDTISVLLSMLGKPVLEPPNRPETQLDGATDVAQELFFDQRDCNARGRQTSEGLLVYADSIGRATFGPSAPEGVRRQRATLLSEGAVAIDGDQLVFLKDRLFPSPSSAASALVGGTQNGRKGWHDAIGRNLHQIEAAALDAASPPEGSA